MIQAISILTEVIAKFIMAQQNRTIKRAVFHKTDISKSLFYMADLRGLDLTDTIHEKVNFENAFYDNNTRWPDGFDPREWDS